MEEPLVVEKVMHFLWLRCSTLTSQDMPQLYLGGLTRI